MFFGRVIVVMRSIFGHGHESLAWHVVLCPEVGCKVLHASARSRLDFVDAPSDVVLILQSLDEGLVLVLSKVDPLVILVGNVISRTM